MVRVPVLICFPSTVVSLNSTGAISNSRGYYYIQNQGRNHEKNLGEAKWLAIICPLPDSDRVNISENLGKAAALSALPLITPLRVANKPMFSKLEYWLQIDWACDCWATLFNLKWELETRVL